MEMSPETRIPINPGFSWSLGSSAHPEFPAGFAVGTFPFGKVRALKGLKSGFELKTELGKYPSGKGIPSSSLSL